MVVLFIYYGNKETVMSAEEVPRIGTSFLVSWKADSDEPKILVTETQPTKPNEDAFFRVYGTIIAEGAVC